MQTLDSINLTDEDYQLIEANRLGMPLNVYRLKPGSIRLFRILGLITFFMGLIILALVMIPGTAPNTKSSFRDNLPSLLGGLYAIFQGGVFYRIMARQAQSTRVIVCERGLIQIRKIIKRNRVAAVYWQDIPPIKKTFGQDYSFFYIKEGKITQFSLTGSYQSIDELVRLIKQRSEEVSQREAE